MTLPRKPVSTEETPRPLASNSGPTERREAVKSDPRQTTLGWTTSAPAFEPEYQEPPRGSKPVRSLTLAFHQLRTFGTDPEPIPVFLRILDTWQPAHVIGFGYEGQDAQTGPYVTVRTEAGGRLRIRNRDLIRLPGGDAKPR